MESTAYLQLFRRMADLTPPLFVMGGFAEDALLHGRLTQIRADLDLLVEREGLDGCLSHLESSGVNSFEPTLADSSGRPLCLASVAGGPAVEVWVCDCLDDGRYSLELPGEVPRKPSQSGRFRLILPPDTFQTAPSELEGISIRVVSPLALYLLRETSARTRGKADRAARDRELCAALKRAYLGSHSTEQLTPELLGV